MRRDLSPGDEGDAGSAGVLEVGDAGAAGATGTDPPSIRVRAAAVILARLAAASSGSIARSPQSTAVTPSGSIRPPRSKSMWSRAAAQLAMPSRIARGAPAQ